MLDENGPNVIGRQCATELNQIVLFFFHSSGVCASEFVDCNKAFYLVKVFCKQMIKTAGRLYWFSENVLEKHRKLVSENSQFSDFHFIFRNECICFIHEL